MSIVTTIFSALGNNSSLYPIIFKDSIDNTGRVIMAYKEGSKNGKNYGMYDARERFLEENSTSLIWIGGIPALKFLYDKLVINKIYKFENIENLGSTFDKKGKRALAQTNINLLDTNGLQTLKQNVDNIREAAKTNPTLKKLVEQADKILANPDKFKKIQAGKMFITTMIPLVTVGFILPKIIQRITKNIYREEKNQKAKQQTLEAKTVNIKNNQPVFSAFESNPRSDKQVNFKGGLGSTVVNIFNNDVCNQAILDVGISGGRIITGVNTADKIEKAIKEAGIVFFIYLGGRIIANLLEKVGNAIGMPISLDSKILEDENFKNEIIKISKASTPQEKEALKNQLLHFSGTDEKSIIAFIDDQIANGVENNTFKNTTLKLAQKLGLVELIEGVKNPLSYIDTNKLKGQVKGNNVTTGLNDHLKELVEKALSKGSPEEVEKFLKKAVNAKRGSIALNLAICSAGTAYFLPKLQYLFREKFTKSSNLPSLAKYDKEIEAEKAG